jgi:hypothetical protein
MGSFASPACSDLARARTREADALELPRYVWPGDLALRRVQRAAERIRLCDRNPVRFAVDASIDIARGGKRELLDGARTSASALRITTLDTARKRDRQPVGCRRRA